MELIASPAILFLDEPTTGLDAATAVSVMRILHELVAILILVVIAVFKLNQILPNGVYDLML